MRRPWHGSVSSVNDEAQQIDQLALLFAVVQRGEGFHRTSAQILHFGLRQLYASVAAGEVHHHCNVAVGDAVTVEDFHNPRALGTLRRGLEGSKKRKSDFTFAEVVSRGLSERGAAGALAATTCDARGRSAPAPALLEYGGQGSPSATRSRLVAAL